MINNKRNGFTLIELLVVVAIIGILATFALIEISNARDRATDAKKKENLNQLSKALQIYYVNEKSFPPNPFGVWCNIGINGCLQELVDKGYMKVLPTPAIDYHYYLYAKYAIIGSQMSTSEIGPGGTNVSACSSTTIPNQPPHYCLEIPK
jgi:general secretion pathway protein G